MEANRKAAAEHQILNIQPTEMVEELGVPRASTVTKINLQFMCGLLLECLFCSIDLYICLLQQYYSMLITIALYYLKLGSTPILFFLYKIVLTVLISLTFHINFRLSLSISKKKVILRF